MVGRAIRSNIYTEAGKPQLTNTLLKFYFFHFFLKLEFIVILRSTGNLPKDSEQSLNVVVIVPLQRYLEMVNICGNDRC